MCGIFGIISHAKLSAAQLKQIADKLFILSERRGKEASGIAYISDKEIQVYKEPIAASEFISKERYAEIFSKDTQTKVPRAVIGHSRMVTNGTEEDQHNNQPVIKHDIVCIQNGIIVNEPELWSYLAPDDTRQFLVDTETINSIAHKVLKENRGPAQAVREVFKRIKGATTTALVSGQLDYLMVGTNNGSLYLSQNEDITIFASESAILEEALAYVNSSVVALKDLSAHHIKPQNGMLINLSDASVLPLSFAAAEQPTVAAASKQRTVTLYPHVSKFKIYFNNLNLKADRSLLKVDEATIKSLKRCTRCILPETFPFIQYDAQGVCNYCHAYKPLVYKGKDKLVELANKYRRGTDQPDCVVPFSGGRDSSYALHVIKKELGLNPVAYTYDWGMITDLARRNISRMCDSLGIEHILISADIRKKRANIRKNVSAWLKRPNLGTVPLFMAGDKQFFYYANQLKEQFKVNLLLFGMNRLERTDFKVAFCGINELADKNTDKHYNMSLLKKLQMVAFYGKEYLLNPAYINSSLWDTFFGFFSYYLIPQEYDTFFEYVRWDENLVNDTIIRNYDWETDPTTKSTWRIGDGTASFYNYIYYRIAGFSENDTFRSNQIREGLISREQALQQVEIENQPRFEAIVAYCDIIGIEFNSAIRAINSAPTRYHSGNQMMPEATLLGKVA